MTNRIKLKPLTNEERTQLEKFSRSATEPYQIVERAKMILLAYQGVPVEQIANKLDRNAISVYTRLNRFKREGIVGLEDKPRSGRKPTYTELERGTMIALARTDPDKLGQPFGHWTLDRLVDYLHNNDQIGVSRAQLARILNAEGLRWYQEKTYFTERPDPQFVEKRGPS